MFAVRGIAVAFSVFVLVYGALSLAMGCIWRRAWIYAQCRSARRSADLLFGMRVLPLITAAIITTMFTVPSFLLLEPRRLNEPMSGVPLGLAAFGILLGIWGVANAGMGLRRASRAIAAWTVGARKLQETAAVPVLRISASFPPLTAAGILRPRVLLSSAAESALTPGELQTALNHEMAHVERRDNLRKLLIRFVSFPGMGGLEAAWLEAIEMAADDAAVSNAREALDLAAALIKVSRLGPVESPVDLTAALVRRDVRKDVRRDGPADLRNDGRKLAAAMNARVERLVAWSDAREGSRQDYSFWYGMAASVAMLAVLATTYSHLLVGMHTATEWLVR